MERPTRSPSEPSPGRRAGQRSAAAESVDKRPEAAARGKLIDAVDNSPRMLAQRQQLRSMFGDAVQLQGGPEEDELLQGKWATIQRQGPEDEELQMKAARSPLAQLQAEPPAPENSTGLPDKLKSGIESLSGISMDHVNVHYNSPQPAQLNALAYAQGSDIHVAPGQEQHLPHEAWHLVQQAQGRVRPTMQMKDGVPVNDDEGLEHEADVMGNKALSNAARLPGAPEKRRPLQGRVALPLPLPQRTGPERRAPQTKALRPASSPSENVGGAFRGSQERSLSVEPGGKQNATISSAIVTPRIGSFRV